MEDYERLAEMAPQLPGTRLVYLADREADIMAQMRRADALTTPVAWLLLLWGVNPANEVQRCC